LCLPSAPSWSAVTTTRTGATGSLPWRSASQNVNAASGDSTAETTAPDQPSVGSRARSASPSLTGVNE